MLSWRYAPSYSTQGELSDGSMTSFNDISLSPFNDISLSPAGLPSWFPAMG